MRTGRKKKPKRSTVAPASSAAPAGDPSTAILRKLTADVSRFSAPGAGPFPAAPSAVSNLSPAAMSHDQIAIPPLVPSPGSQVQDHQPELVGPPTAARTKLDAQGTRLARALQLGVRAAPVGALPTSDAPSLPHQQQLARDLRAQARGSIAHGKEHKRGRGSSSASTQDDDEGDLEPGKKCRRGPVQSVPRCGPALVDCLAQMAAARSDRWACPMLQKLKTQALAVGKAVGQAVFVALENS